MGVCRVGDIELYFEDLGGPPERTIVFLHGLLLSFEMMEPIAKSLAGEFRPVLLELHGHGRSSRPVDPEAYSMKAFSDDLVAVADALGQDRIAVFGTSLGADVALRTMVDHPDRIAGAVVEMPVLEQGARTARRMFKPFARALKTKYAPRALSAASRRMPNARFLPGFAEALEHLAREPAAGAAIIEGLLAEAERYRWDDVVHCDVPALVIAHSFDPLHAFADARMVAARLPNAQLIRAYSVLELRVRPRRLMGISSRFFDRVFSGGVFEAEEPAS